MVDGPNAKENIMFMQNFILSYETSACVFCYIESQLYLLYHIRMDFNSKIKDPHTKTHMTFAYRENHYLSFLERHQSNN